MNLPKFVIIASLALSGAAYGRDCNTVALYARSIMLLRNLEAPIPTNVSIPPPFPAAAIVEEVMNFQIVDQEAVSLKMLAECIEVGYENFPRRLREMKLERMMGDR